MANANGTSNPTLTAALAYLRAGLSVIPIKPDGSKAPAVAWKCYQKRLPTDAELRQWFARPGGGIAIVGGKVSGHLEQLDFDWEAQRIFPQWCALVETEGPGLVARLTVTRTPKPGYHVRYRCPEVEIPGNHDLALTDNPAERVLIQTRGEGGYALAPGSPAACHPLGKTYDHHNGPKLSQVGAVTAAERDILIRCARSFDRRGAEVLDPFCGAGGLPGNGRFRGTAQGAGPSPGDDFNRRGLWDDILTPHGWVKVGERGPEVRWRRPGKHDEGHSATTGVARDQHGNHKLHVFTSNAPPFGDGGNYSKFHAFALLNHGGDFKAAAQALKQLGYGRQQQAKNGPANGSRPGDADKANGTAPEVFGLATVCLADVTIVPVRWLVPGYVPLGKPILFAGDGGHGKSALTLDLAACLTTGRRWLGLEYAPMEAAEVLLVSCEDDLGDTVVPRLLAAGADLMRIHHVHGIKTKEGRPAPFSLAHYQEMEETLKARPNIRLVVIDPAGAYIGRSGVDDHRDSELRALLQPLADLAARYRLCIILVKHLNKGATVKAVHKVGGSVGYVNSVRAVFLVAPEAGDEAKKLFLPIKFNLGRKPSGLGFHIQDLETERKADIIRRYGEHLAEPDKAELAQQLFRIAWDGAVSVDADQLFADAGKRDRRPSKVEQAKEWLPQFLAEYAYPSDEVVEAGVAQGLSRDTLFAARKQLPTIRASNRGRFGGVWYWGIGNPDNWTPRPQPDTSDTTDTMERTREETHENSGDSPIVSVVSEVSEHNGNGHAIPVREREPGEEG